MSHSGDFFDYLFRGNYIVIPFSLYILAQRETSN